jgi:hypothetical protein
MDDARSASSQAAFRGWTAQDAQPLTLLRRLIVEIEDSIAQSREVILSTRDAIELLERLQGRHQTDTGLLLLQLLAQDLQT